MSAPSDGARADARKARVAGVAGDALSAVMVLSLAQEIRVVDGNHDLGAGALADALTPWLAGVIADAKAEALREVADLYRSLGDSLPICAGHVVAELDIRADDWARR